MSYVIVNEEIDDVPHAKQETCFNFSRLSPLLQRQVIVKLSGPEWFLLRRCSRLAFHVCSTIESRISLECNVIIIDESGIRVLLRCPGTRFGGISIEEATSFPFRLIVDAMVITEPLHGQRVQMLYDLFLNTEAEINQFDLRESVHCDTDDLVKLVELRTIILMDCDINDGQLLKLNAPHIRLPSSLISGQAINQFLREWSQGIRKVDTFELSTSRTRYNVDEIVSNLPVNLLWSEESHQHSIVSNIPLNEIENFDVLASFVLWLPNNVFDTFVLEIKRHSIHFKSDHYLSVFFRLLNYDQYSQFLSDCEE